MLLRLGALAIVLLALMAAVKNHGLLGKAGLTGSCSVVKTSAQAQLEACRPGKLEGRPDLSGHGCTSTGYAGRYQYWHCPAPLVAGVGDR